MKFLSVAVIALGLVFSGFAYGQDTPQAALDGGNVAGALEMLQEQAKNDDIEVAVAGLCGEAQMQFSAGNADKAVKLLEEAGKKLDSNKKLKKSPWHAVVAYLNASFARQNGKKDAAADFIKTAQKKAKDAKMDASWAGAVDLEASYILEDDNSAARKAAESAIKHFKSADMKHEQGHAEMRLGDLEMARDKPKPAAKSYESAIASLRASDKEKRCIAEAYLHIAETHIHAKNKKAAESYMKTAGEEIDIAGKPQDLVDKYEELKKALSGE